MKVLSFIAGVLLTATSFAQSIDFIAARAQASADVTTLGLSYNSDRNIYTSRGNIIHIFIFEDGNLLLAGHPTTATEKDKYIVHLYVRGANRDNFLLEYTGSYSPVFNIQGSNALAAPPSIVRIDFSVIGPFTGSLQMTLKTQPAAGGNFTTVSAATITISRTIHISLGSGLIYTSLKDPSNIRVVPIPGSTNNTLIADDETGRGMLTLMATFYPGGRNSLMMQSKKFRDHFGISVGTPLSAGSSNFRDLFAGFQYDFAMGGSIVGGGHFGRRQKIMGIDYKDFEFGKTQFIGNLDELKHMEWSLGLFIGIQVDSRVFAQLFAANK